MKHTLPAVAAFALALTFALPAIAAHAVVTIGHAATSAASDAADYEWLIPVVGEVGFYFAIIGGLVAALLFRYKSDQQRLETLRQIVEKGAEVPADLFARRGSPRASDLKKGLILLALGIGVAGALVTAHLASSAGFGLIPALVGLAYLIVSRVEGRGTSRGMDE